jgi:hypothetical protein
MSASDPIADTDGWLKFHHGNALVLPLLTYVNVKQLLAFRLGSAAL